MVTRTAPDPTTAAAATADKSTAELDNAYGHLINGAIALYEDPEVPQHQKTNLFMALGDRFYRGVLDVVATLTGQPDARLALEGGTDPVVAPPAPPAATPPSAELASAQAELAAANAQITAVKSWITSNGGSLVGDDLTAGVNNVLRTKEAAAAVLPAGQTAKAPIKASITTALAAANAPKDEGGFHQSAVPGSTAMVISKPKYDEMIAGLAQIETAVA